jgi:type IV secretion system protein VirB1
MWTDQLPQCAPTVHPYTMEQIVRVESAGNPLAVHVNGLADRFQPGSSDTADAVATAKRWIALGYRVDLGMMQISDRNLPALHLTIEQVLGTDADTVCANLAGGARILTADYVAATLRFEPGQPALKAALSAYNTGTFDKGFANGYVARYFTVPSVVLQTPTRVIPVVTVNHRASDTEAW